MSRNWPFVALSVTREVLYRAEQEPARVYWFVTEQRGWQSRNGEYWYCATIVCSANIFGLIFSIQTLMRQECINSSIEPLNRLAWLHNSMTQNRSFPRMITTIVPIR